jgi:hypothetical protein
LKIAFDENVPVAMVRVFQTFAKERQLRKLMGNFSIESAADYTPKLSDVDYARKNDVPWIKRFAGVGGKVIISGNTEMKNIPHERLALLQEGMVVIFFESRWNDWNFFRKCALLLHWWPVIAKKIKTAKRGTFWHIPLNWVENGKLRKVSTEDAKKLKIERQLKAKNKQRSRRRKKRVIAPVTPAQGDLLDLIPVLAVEKNVDQATKKNPT